MEICRIDISIDDLKKLNKQGIRYDLKLVEEDSFDYSKDDVWQRLKSESSKAYKKLKKREFDLRFKKKSGWKN